MLFTFCWIEIPVRRRLLEQSQRRPLFLASDTLIDGWSDSNHILPANRLVSQIHLFSFADETRDYL